MRRILIASLLLSPVAFTASAVASQPGTDATAQPQDLRISTGVIAPELVYSTTIVSVPSYVAVPHDSKVVLSFHVDEKGKTSKFQVIDAANPILAEHVVDTVGKFRFLPAKLDNQPVPMDMTWTVEVDK